MHKGGACINVSGVAVASIPVFGIYFVTSITKKKNRNKKKQEETRKKKKESNKRSSTGAQCHHQQQQQENTPTYPLGTPTGMAASPPAASPPAAKSTCVALRFAFIICLQTSHSSLPVAMAYFGAMNLPEPNLWCGACSRAAKNTKEQKKKM